MKLYIVGSKEQISDPIIAFNIYYITRCKSATSLQHDPKRLFLLQIGLCLTVGSDETNSRSSQFFKHRLLTNSFIAH